MTARILGSRLSLLFLSLTAPGLVAVLVSDPICLWQTLYFEIGLSLDIHKSLFSISNSWLVFIKSNHNIKKNLSNYIFPWCQSIILDNSLYAFIQICLCDPWGKKQKLSITSIVWQSYKIRPNCKSAKILMHLSSSNVSRFYSKNKDDAEWMQGGYWRCE